MRIAVVTEARWKTLPARVAALSERISALLPEKVEIVIVQKEIGKIPVASDGRVSRDFMNRVLAVGKEFQGACLLFESKHLQNPADYKLGLKGFYLNDNDGFIEFFVCSSEKGKDRSYFGNLRFERAFAHELLHGLYDWVGVEDRTHHWDKTLRQIEKGYAEVAAAWSKTEPEPKDPSKADFTGYLPAFVDWYRRVRKEMANLGKPVFAFEAYRTDAKQREYWMKGRNERGEVVDKGKVVTNAKPGESPHNRRKAIDIVFDHAAPWSESHDWKTLGAIGKAVASAMGLKVSWGGDWKPLDSRGLGWDKPHFEIS